MRITTKGRQAVSAMIDVAQHQQAGPVALTGVSRRQRISLSYLEQMFADLRRHGLVTSTRGPGGGYVIARDAKTITVADVICAVDRGNVARGPGAERSEANDERCLAPEFWSALSQRVIDFLASVDLQKLIDDEAVGATQAIQVRPIVPAVRRDVPVRARYPVVTQMPNSVFDLARLVRD